MDENQVEEPEVEVACLGEPRGGGFGETPENEAGTSSDSSDSEEEQENVENFWMNRRARLRRVQRAPRAQEPRANAAPVPDIQNLRRALDLIFGIGAPPPVVPPYIEVLRDMARVLLDRMPPGGAPEVQAPNRVGDPQR